MPRWWLIVIAIAGAWLVLLGAGQVGLLTRISLDALVPFVRHAIFAVTAVAAFQCGRQGSAAWCGTLAFLAALLNTIAPPDWPRGWEHPFELCAGLVLLAFSVRQWN